MSACLAIGECDQGGCERPAEVVTALGMLCDDCATDVYPAGVPQ